MQYEWAHPGRLVVCIHRAWTEPALPGEVFPKYQRVYTIREVMKGEGEELFLTFEELRNPAVRGIYWSPKEARFHISRFRPVNTQIIDKLLTAKEFA